MTDEREKRSVSGNGENEPPSGGAILVYFIVLAVALVGGYFLLMKLIEISRQEDRILRGGHNCAAPIAVPAR